MQALAPLFPRKKERSIPIIHRMHAHVVSMHAMYDRWSHSSLFPSSHQVGTHTSYSEKGIKRCRTTSKYNAKDPSCTLSLAIPIPGVMKG